MTILSLNLAPQFTIIIFVSQLENVPTHTVYVLQLRHREVFSDGPCIYTRSLSNYLIESYNILKYYYTYYRRLVM